MIQKTIYLKFALIFCLILVVGCSELRAATSHTEVVDCQNLVFKCDYDDCNNYCGKYASSQKERMTGSEPINGGNACSCQMTPIV